jgi:hypothetical protein
VSRAGVALLRALSVDTGLAHGWTNVLLDTYKGSSGGSSCWPCAA